MATFQAKNMKALLKFLLVIYLLMGVPSGTSAQTSDEFRSVWGRFGIALPKTYSEHKSVWMDIGQKRWLVGIYRWDTPSGIFTVSFSDGESDLEEPQQAKEFLTAFSRKYALNRSLTNGRLIVERPFSFEERPGFELVEDRNGMVVDLRVFVFENRFYSLSLALKPEQRDFGKLGEKILASFRLLSAAEIAEVRDSLLPTFAPDPLPQSPSIRRPRSDAEDENLHGGVKTVLTEEQRLYGGKTFRYRDPVEVKTFNRQGELVTKVGYFGGVPSDATTYGYLEGARAYKKASRAGLPLGGPKENAANVALSPRKIQHKYDANGNLIEVKVARVDGKLEGQYSYRTEGRKRETTYEGLREVFGVSLDERWKSMAELDERGNPVRETRQDFSHVPDDNYSSYSTRKDPNADSPLPPAPVRPNQQPKLVLKKTGEKDYTFTYEYDARGNWIKRITSEEAKTKSGTAMVATKVTYRTIEYY